MEQVTYNHVRRQPGVQFRGSCKVDRLLFSDAATVTGVEVRFADGTVEAIPADLVVDCTGRVSKVPQVLAQVGYDPIQQFTLNIGTSYTSALVRAPADAADGFEVLVVLPEPPAKRGAFVARLMDDRWIVSLHTRFESDLPKTYQEMVAFAETIEVPDIAAFLARAALDGERGERGENGEIRSYRKGEAVWRRYDKAERFPEGLLVLGDAMASFNPIFGQGMSVASLQACALDDVLTARAANNAGLQGISKEFFPLAATIARAAWNSSTAVDSAYQEVTGDRNPNAALTTKVMIGLRRLIVDDPQLHADMIAVGQMTASGDRLLTPERLARALAAAESA
jgi:2-polyprenyl-6-methoxyphenol hydroxylase-like FAD-dependent oxidoreductase